MEGFVFYLTFLISKTKRVDLPKNKFWFKVLLPRLQIEGKYELDMSILFVNLKGRGPITGNFCK